MLGATEPVPADHGASQSQLLIKEKELARDDLLPVLEMGMAMNHSAERVRPTKDKFMGAQRWSIGEDRGDIQCAVIKLREIVEQSQCCFRAVESKSQGSIPLMGNIRERYSRQVFGRHVRRLRRR